MLFPLQDETSRCEIFKGLNDEILYFLKTSIDKKQFNKYMLSEYLRNALWTNEPTKKKFRALWKQLKSLSAQQRCDIYNEYSQKQFLQHYYEDTAHPLPNIPPAVGKELGLLCKHLFSKSSSLVQVKTSCGESLHDSFGKFREKNKNICCFCGSSELAQVRAGVEEDKQWRAANDHLLSKDDYPVYAVHPDNLMPLCETCNSKAKLAKDLINIKRKGQPDVRRRCFYPFAESCSKYVGVVLEKDNFGLIARFTMSAENPEVGEKLDTWNDVYQIERRVEGKFTDLASLVDSDCPANDLTDFSDRIRAKAAACKTHYNIDAWNFWKYKLYHWIDQHGGWAVDELWESIVQKRADQDAADIYGI